MSDHLELIRNTRAELSDDLPNGVGNQIDWAVEEIERLRDALEAIKELADADETFLCWKTANDALEGVA